MTAPVPVEPVASAPEPAAAAPVAPVVAAPVPTPPPVQPVTPTAPAAEATPAKDPDVFDRSYVEELRREAAKHRTTAGEEKTAREAAAAQAAAHETKLSEMQAVLDAITKAVTGKTDEAPDPAKLAEQLAAAEAARVTLAAEKDAQIRELTIRSTLPTAFAKAGANPDLTTAVLTANGTLKSLDPASPTFAADLESAVTAALESHPQLKTTPVAVRSGAEIPGRSGGSDQLTLEQVRELQKTNPTALIEAQKAGRLAQHLGIK